MSAMGAAFDEAARRRPDELVVAWLQSPAGPIRVRVVGRCLAGHIEAALGHLATGAQPAALDVDLWDESVTGVGCPLPSDATNFPRDVNGTLVRVDPTDSRRLWTRGRGSVTELDGGHGRMVGWRADGSALAIEERGRPFPVALQAWLQSRGVVTVHAAGVACGGKAALIVGDAGSGKSTTALACAAAGFGFLGDDQVAVGWLDGRAVAHSLFASVRVDGIVHRLWRDVTEPEHGPVKALVLLSGAAVAVVPSAAVGAVLVARVSPGEPSTLERATTRDALRAMVPSTLPGAVDDRPAVLRSCARTVLGRPAFHLRVGADLEAVPGLVARALTAGT